MFRVSFILAAALVGWQAGDASATGVVRLRSFNCGHSYNYVAPAAVYYPPVYSIGIQPDLSAIAQSLEKLTQLQEGQQQLIQAMLQANGKQFAPERPGLALMIRDCAKCHDSTTAKRGGGHVFFDRGQLIAKQEDIEAMVKAVDEGRMPKDRKWTGDEKYVFLSFHALKQPEPEKLPQPQIAPKPVDIERLIDQRLSAILEKMQAPKAPPKKDDGEQPKR